MLAGDRKLPIYEFQCGSCLYVFEFILKISDEHPTTCSQCNQENVLRKIISIPSSLGRKTDSESEAYQVVDKMKRKGRLSIERPQNFVKDDDGHFVEADTRDPKVLKKAIEDQKKKEKDKKEYEKQREKAQVKILEKIKL